MNSCRCSFVGHWTASATWPLTAELRLPRPIRAGSVADTGTGAGAAWVGKQHAGIGEVQSGADDHGRGDCRQDVGRAHQHVADGQPSCRPVRGNERSDPEAPHRIDGQRNSHSSKKASTSVAVKLNTACVKPALSAIPKPWWRWTNAAHCRRQLRRTAQPALAVRSPAARCRSVNSSGQPRFQCTEHSRSDVRRVQGYPGQQRLALGEAGVEFGIEPRVGVVFESA